ncbi:DUF2911 domain-containing protein [Algoriphagus antarcticus]|nr:DUF2911 domain-containing protein [Algoriphagus antarcticus]
MRKCLLSLSILAAVACSSEKSSDHEGHDMDQMESESHEMHEEKPAEAPKSPRTSAMAMTGGNHIHIDYSAPSARGRQIFGGLVAHDEVWVTGAHKATSIQFDQPVTISGKRIKAGKYGFFTIPGESEWTVILNQVWDMHLADDYDQSKDFFRFMVKPNQLSETVEALTFEVKEKDAKTTTIAFSWDKTKISFDVVNAEK